MDSLSISLNDLKRFGRAIALFAVALLLSMLPMFGLQLAGLPQSPPPPNIVFILADDLDAEAIATMPQLQKLMVKQGASFDDFLISVSLCCPSRASILRGQYAHNTQVLTNGGINGGFELAYRSGLEKSTIATWLQTAGYQTAFLGKYLNGYPRTTSQTYFPPGWNLWASAVAGKPYSEFNYTLNENGKLVAYGAEPTDYGTDVYTRKAVEFMKSPSQAGKPFFVYLSVYAPHQPATPAPRHRQLFLDAALPRSPSFDEADVSDKPQFIQQLPRISPEIATRVGQLYQRRLQSLQAVDEAVATLVETLEKTQQLANTYIVFTSDNGFHLGQHRMPAGKQTAYEEDIRVPLIIRGPGVPAGQRRSQLVGNVDLAPTFAEWARVPVPDFVDGRSLVPLLQSKLPAQLRWRQSYLLEHWQEKSAIDQNSPPLPGPEPREPGDIQDARPAQPTVPGAEGVRVSKAAQALVRPPDYQGLRTQDYTYVDYRTGEQELYDLRTDPYQLQNLVAKFSPARVQQFSNRLDQLRQCQAAGCRTAEEQPLAIGK